MDLTRTHTRTHPACCHVLSFASLVIVPSHALLWLDYLIHDESGNGSKEGSPRWTIVPMNSDDGLRGGDHYAKLSPDRLGAVCKSVMLVCVWCMEVKPQPSGDKKG